VSWVPDLRSSAKSAAPRPGQETIVCSNFKPPGANQFLARWLLSCSLCEVVSEATDGFRNRVKPDKMGKFGHAKIESPSASFAERSDRS
jgi:hypothetical protein